MYKFLLLLTLFAGQAAFAGTVDTVTIYSAAMRKNFKCVVIKPDAYTKGNKAYPTVYLLHGHSGAFRNWIRNVPQLKKYADDYGMLIVCPDGAYSSWYLDSPVDTTMRFETYIAKEVPAFIDAKYRTIKDRNARAITGLSMGGHGGLYLGFRHAGFFSACGSMSGAFLLEYIKSGFDVEKRLGDTLTNRHYYTEFTIMKEMENYPKDSVAIIMDCGIDDFIFDMSRAAHQKMLALNIPHDYIERPGKHNWAYWANAVQYQLLYFSNHFQQQAAKKEAITKTN